MLDRLITMANVHIQIGRYSRDFGNCGTGHSDTRRITFERPFESTPKVFTSIFYYDICWDRHRYNRAYTDPPSADTHGFTSVATTWADTKVHGLGVEVRPLFVSAYTVPRTCLKCCIRRRICSPATWRKSLVSMACFAAKS
jgi:hypothetical protein